MNPLEAVDLLAALDLHLEQTPDRTAFTFLERGAVVEAIDYSTLVGRARSLAARLTDTITPGDCVLVVCPPGVEFVVGFLGCLYAGVVAVPCYPPEPNRLETTMQRLLSVAVDCDARTAITVADAVDLAKDLAATKPELAAVQWLAIDGVDATAADGSAIPEVRSSSLAFLQYTSGSTDSPRGVMITHQNIMANLRLIHDGVAQTAESVSMLWLPPYHDMGLMNILYSLVGGFPCVAMSPLDFVKRPLSWLRAISEYRATYSGAPNFAYNLCAARASDADVAALDLTRWEVAFCGAEPIRADVAQRFIDRFTPAGFRSQAFYACYGLAEHTVAVSGVDKGSGLSLEWVDSDRLKEDGVAEPVEGETIVEVVSCGRSRLGHELLIVDPESRLRLPDGHVGEIWCTGPSKAAGYWHQPEASEETFEATLAQGGDGVTYLRTGDLGYMRSGYLFVTGRRKEVIIIHARNLYPHTIEREVEELGNEVRPGGVIAFGTTVDGVERLVIAVEVRSMPEDGGAALRRQIRRQTKAAEGVIPFDVALVAGRSLPTTTSGKLRRLECRRRWETGELEIFDTPGTASAFNP